MNAEAVGPATYRPNVAAVVTDESGALLVCERADRAGAWQFPQGGIDPGETPEEALGRELAEELSLQPGDYEAGRCYGPYRYLFENGRTKEGYAGQEQRYFAVRLTAPRGRIRLDTAHREFQAARWIAPRDFELGWLPEMKKPVYQAVLREIFGVDFSRAR